MDMPNCTEDIPIAKAEPWERHPDAERVILYDGPLGDAVPPNKIIVLRCPYCGKEEKVV